MRIDLLRHGQTGRDGYLDGRTDSPLSELGWGEFRRQTEVACWPSLVTSPLQRAQLAAEDHARRHSCALRIDDDWAELNFGDWDGRLRADIIAEPEVAASFAAFYSDPAIFTAPGGESWDDLQQRVARAIDRLFDASETPTLVVTHGGAVRAALAQILGWPLRQLWSLRIDTGTRIRLDAGRSDDGALWGEIIEIIQP